VPGDTNLHTVHLYGYNYASSTPLLLPQFIASLPGAGSVTNTPANLSAKFDFDYSVQFQADHTNDALTVVVGLSKTSGLGALSAFGINAAAMDGPAPVSPVNWRVIAEDTNYPTVDTLVAGVVIGDVINGTNALPTNTTNTDCAPYFQAAMNWLSSYGGGTVYVPPGQYCFSNSLSIPQGVTLRGRWVQPGLTQPVKGTIFAIYAGVNDTNAPAFIDNCGTPSAVRDLAFWYPQQNATNPVYYPYTLHRYNRDLTTMRNLTLVNSYRGISGDAWNDLDAQHIYGTTLLTGMYGNACAEVARIEDVHLAPDYWVWSGLPGAPTNTAPLSAFMLNNTNSIGIDVVIVGGTHLMSSSVSGYCYGFRSTSSSTVSIYNLTVTNCTEAVRIEFMSGIDMINCNLAGTRYGLHRLAGEIPNFYGCTISGGTNAIMDENNGASHDLFLDNCTLTGAIDMGNRGALYLRSSRFTTTGTNILLASGMGLVQVVNAPNANCGQANIQLNGVTTNNPNLYLVSTNGLVSEPNISFSFNYARTTKPDKSALFNVQSASFAGGATGNGFTDDTAAITAAIAAAQTNGGGVVFFPPGNYVVKSPLVVSNGVELRGTLDFWVQKIANPGGSTVEVQTGMNSSNGTPFIMLGDRCGIRGLNFDYPAQAFTNGITYVPFPYMIQCHGMSNYLNYVGCANAYQGVDVNSGHNALVDFCNVDTLINAYRIRGGSTNCLLEHLASFSQEFFYGMVGDVFVAEDCTNLTIFSTYVHLQHTMVIVRGGSVQALLLSGEQLQRGFVLESGSGAITALGSGCKVNALGDGMGWYNFWLQTNYTGTVTFTAGTAHVSTATGGGPNQYALRVDNPNASFIGYSASFEDTATLWDLYAAGKVTLVGTYLGQCSFIVPAGGQLNAAQSYLGSMPYVPQAGTVNFNTNCQFTGTSFIAADTDESPFLSDGITMNTNNLTTVIANTSNSGTNPYLTNSLMITGWTLASGSNFQFHVTSPAFTNGVRPNVTIAVACTGIPTNGSLTVSYDSTGGMKTLSGLSSTVTDARFSAANGWDILLVASNANPVVQYVAVYATNYLGVPAQLLSSPVANFIATPTNGVRPLPVTFTDQSTGSITNLLWNFGDNQTTNTAAGFVVSHTYATNGTYTVSLMASGSAGSSTNIKTSYITVNVPASPKIGSIRLSGTTALVLQGSGGPTNGGYYYWLRSSTNLALPLTNWSIVATNPFDVQGNFSNNIPLTPGTPQIFYRLQLP
jgi:PKD repeat protein